jgi:flagellar motor component MotA
MSNEKQQLLQCISNIWKNMNDAQVIKGVLSMGECRALLIAKNNIVKFIEESNQAEISFEISKEISESINLMMTLCGKIHASGVFNIEGSAHLLNQFEYINNRLSLVTKDFVETSTVKNVEGNLPVVEKTVVPL